MFGLGFTEIVFLAVLILVVIGPKQLPEVAKTIGRFLNEIKRSTDAVKADFLGSDFENPVTKIRDDLRSEIMKTPEQAAQEHEEMAARLHSSNQSDRKSNGDDV
jgi:sec-independent protein translocase protein TatB